MLGLVHRDLKLENVMMRDHNGRGILTLIDLDTVLSGSGGSWGGMFDSPPPPPPPSEGLFPTGLEMVLTRYGFLEHQTVSSS